MGRRRTTTRNLVVAPSRARGLKLDSTESVEDAVSRALTGAWIETRVVDRVTAFAEGRALTGAWIETIRSVGDADAGRIVAPSRARGLKHCIY